MADPQDCAKDFSDDPAVGDGTTLLRRIPENHFHFDHNLGRMPPSSAAFEDDRDGDPMSVYRKDVIDAEGGDVKRVLIGHQGYALAGITAGLVRSREHTVFSDPLPDESSHAKVCGHRTKRLMREFARKAEWVVPPPAP